MVLFIRQMVGEVSCLPTARHLRVGRLGYCQGICSEGYGEGIFADIDLLEGGHLKATGKMESL